MTFPHQISPPDNSTLALVERAHESLVLGYAAESATARHRAAHLAALRAAAAVVAARDRRRRHEHAGPVSLWDLLTRLTPELSEWSRHFALVTRRLSLVESGRVRVSVREADDLLRDAESFLARAEMVIGLPVRIEAHPGLAPVRTA
ncbi:MAG TPA: SAV_6107 family HEPN domain-containing protein [Phycicoccus sp.]|jgi:hypothetical protein|nr:SAV_6107 family HEPN domain-containing protein [Phycicoccus sp.]HQK30931.1 SAV_6107 family HEPN domain-containing protein [Phycicoccus sp.]HQY96014.1 SAV_6107 family HEPN domain-containing protein [Phycicoccus sp.]HRA44075.1 SAV_6107 family HEPN domain-containing protein [Phycicoccus sp.]